MLVWCLRFCYIIVALSLVAVLTVVTSAKTEAGASSGSEDLALHATKISGRRFNQTVSRKEEKSAMESRAVEPGANFNAGFWNYSAAQMEQQSSTSGSLSSKTNKKNQRKTDDEDEESQDTGRSAFWSEDIQVGCRELRARRYISDGFCTSEEPIKEVACAGSCLPIMDMPWYAEFVKTVAKNKLKDWQCVEDVVRKKRVKLLCRNGSFRHYKIKVVESCKCKKVSNIHNRTTHQKKKKRRKDKKEDLNNGS